MADYLKTKREVEWLEIEDLISVCQNHFNNPDISTEAASQDAMNELIHRFQPLFLKYIKIIKYCDINFFDQDTKAFVFSFIDKDSKKCFPFNKKSIIHKFYFIINTYGALEEDEILSDMYEVFITLIKRYKQIGKSFCGYISSIFRYEMNRLIKSYVSNPLNVSYNIYSFDDNLITDTVSMEQLIDDYCLKKEVLSLDWIKGNDCSFPFSSLSVIERKILIEYYINKRTEHAIASLFGIHRNTVNYMRHQSIEKINKLLY